MQCIAKAPDFIRRTKAVHEGLIIDPTLLFEMRANYEALKCVVVEFRDLLLALERKLVPEASRSFLDPHMQRYTLHQRLYGLTLVVGIILNFVLASLDDVYNLHQLHVESDEFVRGILSIWRNIANYKPIGSTCLQLYLYIAWLGTSDPALRHEIKEAVNELEGEFTIGKLPKSAYTEDMVNFWNPVRSNM